MTTTFWIAAGVVVSVGAALLWSRARGALLKRQDTVTPRWVNDKAYDRDHGSREDRQG